jgi:hypothetical protein
MTDNMSFQDTLTRDYRGVCDRLSERLGVSFEIASTGGSCYAIAGTLETRDLVLITDASDATLNPLAETEGFGVGIYAETEEGNEQVVYVADSDATCDQIADLLVRAIRERSVQR